MRTLRSCAGVQIISLVAFLAICFSSSAQSTAPNEWAWMGGINTDVNALGVYGTLGSPAAVNTPGARGGVATWTDKNGNFWLFGGGGLDSVGAAGSLNDLWEFDPSTREWTWMSGSSVLASYSCGGQVCGGNSGVYGTLGVPAPQNVPGGRSGAASWTDNNGDLWLFGGYGPSPTGYTSFFNDLWRFNPSTREWTWMSGSSTGPTAGGPLGVYGTLGQPSAANVPGARYKGVSWTSRDGNLWLFGGYGYDSVGNVNPLNDLWQFNPSTSEWTWMGGSSTAPRQYGLHGVYGTQGVPAASNYPGSRYEANAWTDQSGNLWLFGGTGADSDGRFSFLNDLWEFNPTSQVWAWIGGSDAISCAPMSCGEAAMYGTPGVPAARNHPGGRTGASASIDGSGNFWLFGGYGNDDTFVGHGYLNDLWVFNPSTREWAWRSGSSSLRYDWEPQPGVYGTLGTPAIGNVPGGREWATSWVDRSGNYWLFGGFAELSVGNMNTLNDLWEDEAAATTWPTPPPTFSVLPGTYASTQTVTISDATAGATIYYTTDRTMPTVNSTVYTNPISVSVTKTIQAIATSAGYSQSAVASNAFVITPNIAIAGTAVSVAPGATTGNTSTISVTPGGGFTGSVVLTAAITSSTTGVQYPPTLSFGNTSPMNITGPNAGTATLTFTTAAATSAALNYPKPRGATWYAAGGSALACLLLFGIPARRGRGRAVLQLLALIVAFSSGVVACSGGSGGGGGGAHGNPGTTAGIYSINVTGTSGALTKTGTVTLTVQ